MLDNNSNIGRKDIEFHEYRYNSKGMPIGVITAKPVSIFFDKNEISDDEVRKIVDSRRYDISNCMCDDERMVVMTTPMAERLLRIFPAIDSGLGDPSPV
jgi:hypothetical protein